MAAALLYSNYPIILPYQKAPFCPVSCRPSWCRLVTDWVKLRSQILTVNIRNVFVSSLNKHIRLSCQSAGFHLATWVHDDSGRHQQWKSCLYVQVTYGNSSRSVCAVSQREQETTRTKRQQRILCQMNQTQGRKEMIFNWCFMKWEEEWIVQITGSLGQFVADLTLNWFHVPALGWEREDFKMSILCDGFSDCFIWWGLLDVKMIVVTATFTK